LPGAAVGAVRHHHDADAAAVFRLELLERHAEAVALQLVRQRLPLGLQAEGALLRGDAGGHAAELGEDLHELGVGHLGRAEAADVGFPSLADAVGAVGGRFEHHHHGALLAALDLGKHLQRRGVGEQQV
jgi:hypothetical protein